jgi:hypothetical protein
MVLVMKIRCVERRLRSNIVSEGSVVGVHVVAGRAAACRVHMQYFFLVFLSFSQSYQS